MRDTLEHSLILDIFINSATIKLSNKNKKLIYKLIEERKIKMTRRAFDTDIKNILHNNETGGYEAEFFGGDFIVADDRQDNLRNLIVNLIRNSYECHERTVSNALTIAYYLTFKHFKKNNDAPENEIFDYFTNVYKEIKETSDKDLKAKKIYIFNGNVITTDGSAKYIGFGNLKGSVTSDGYYQGEKVRKFNRLQAEMFAPRHSVFYPLQKKITD